MSSIFAFKEYSVSKTPDFPAIPHVSVPNGADGAKRIHSNWLLLYSQKANFSPACTVAL